jgi:hypothetical protein
MFYARAWNRKGGLFMAKGRMTLALAATVALAVLPVTAGAAGKPLPMGMQTITIGPITAGAYRLTLVIAPMQHMYTQAQYNQAHPLSGEIMLGGTMVMGSMGMGMGMPNHHIELHVMDRRTMRVVTNAMVSITYQPVVRMGQMAIRPQRLPVATMIEIGKGMASYHYGNNVSFAPHGTYHITVHVNSAYALFTVRLG